MQCPPASISGQVQAFLAGQPGVRAVHHLHIWSLGAGEIAMTAHLVRPDSGDHDAFIDRLNHELDHRFGINHPTLQVEHGRACEHDRHDRAPHGEPGISTTIATTPTEAHARAERHTPGQRQGPGAARCRQAGTRALPI